MVQTLSRFISTVILVAVFAMLFLGNGAVGLEHLIARSVPAPAIPSASPISDEDGSHALNWAGYVATDGPYTAVAGTWIVPHASAAGDHSADATWVGIGGVVKDDLIQAGTEALPNDDGSLSYQAWLETLPGPSHTIPIDIAPGDSISVSIKEQSAGQWLVSFADGTTGQTYSTSVHYASTNSSAEWIEEMPVEVGGLMGLDNFGRVNFTGGSAQRNGSSLTISDTGARALIMDNTAGESVAAPSQLGPNGSSFTVSRLQADATPLTLAAGGMRATVPQPQEASYTYSYDGNGYQAYPRHHHDSYVFIQF